MTTINELLVQAEELAEMILQAPEVTAYQEAEQRLKEANDAQTMLARVQDLQNQIGEFQARNVPEEYYASLSQESESLLTELETIPEVRSFQAAEEALNDLLKAVSDTLARSVAERMFPERAAKL